MDLPLILLIFPGFIIGILIFSIVGNLLINILGLEPSVTGAQEQDVKHKNRDIYGATAFLASWLLIFGGISIYIWLLANQASGWFWFFVGIAATPAITVSSILRWWKVNRD